MIVLVTGASGSFGSAFVRRVLGLGWTVRAFSRDEFKQSVLSQAEGFEGVRWLLGDVRDLERMRRAVQGVDLVVHAAALKQVASCEYNPDEAVKTNVLGSLNVAEACLDAGVKRAILVSSDKAVHPVNLYGASKLCAEKLWLAAGALGDTLFSVVRYGNVVGSRGGIHDRIERGEPVQLTDARATRFWLPMDDATGLVVKAARMALGGDVFVPKVLSSLVAFSVSGLEVGLGPGEKLHEQLISDEEVRRTWDCGGHYRICSFRPDTEDGFPAVRVSDTFRYTSEVVA